MRPSCGGLSCVEFGETLDRLAIVGERTFAVLEERLVLARIYADRFLVVGDGDIEVLNSRSVPSSQALSSVDQGLCRVSADRVLGDCRSSSVELFVNSRA